MRYWRPRALSAGGGGGGGHVNTRGFPLVCRRNDDLLIPWGRGHVNTRGFPHRTAGGRREHLCTPRPGEEGRYGKYRTEPAKCPLRREFRRPMEIHLGRGSRTSPALYKVDVDDLCEALGRAVTVKDKPNAVHTHRDL